MEDAARTLDRTYNRSVGEVIMDIEWMHGHYSYLHLRDSLWAYLCAPAWSVVHQTAQCGRVLYQRSRSAQSP